MSETEVDIGVQVKVSSELQNMTAEEGQVIIHCSFYNDPSKYAGEVGLRVWKETFLIDEQSGHLNQMVRAFGIVYEPKWFFVKNGKTKKFTLLFDALPKSCKTFTLAEIIPQSGAFIVKNIPRNETDVYKVNLE